MTETQWRSWIRERVQKGSALRRVLEGSLACSPRPLRYAQEFGGRIQVLPPESGMPLLKWIDAVRELGVVGVYHQVSDQHIDR